VNMDGSEGPRCQSVRQFAANLLARLDVPILFWDERWSTAAMTRAMLDADVSRRRRARAVDMMAAAYILQGALDALRRQPVEAGGVTVRSSGWCRLLLPGGAQDFGRHLVGDPVDAMHRAGVLGRLDQQFGFALRVNDELATRNHASAPQFLLHHRSALPL